MSSRQLLRDLMVSTGDTMTSLSLLLGRNAAYMQQYIVRGSPGRLSRKDQELLARHFVLPHDFLYNPDRRRLVRLRIAANAVNVAIVRCHEAGAMMEVASLEQSMFHLDAAIAQESSGRP